MGEIIWSKKSVILVVADNWATRYLLRQILEVEGYTIIDAVDGAQALLIVKQTQPDLFLIDDCTLLQELPGGNCTLVLVMIAVDDDETVNFAFEAGTADCIVKLINAGVLRQRVNRLLHAGQTAVLLEQSETDDRYVIKNTLDGLITVDEHGLIQSF